MPEPWGTTIGSPRDDHFPASAGAAPPRRPPNQDGQKTMTDSYAESVAIVGMSRDGDFTLSGRLARFPAKKMGSLWLTITAGQQHYSVAEEFPLKGFSGQTDIGSANVEFMQPGSELAWFVRRGSSEEPFRGSAVLRACAHSDWEPPLGAGPTRVGFQAEFVAKHLPVSTRTGRTEVFGTVSATLDLPNSQIAFDGLGKWHEQVGERPNFGGAFTYMSVQMPSVSILARAGAGGSWGVLVSDGNLVGVKHFRIDPPAETRRFELAFADGRETAGTTSIRWLESVPIEGLRRPGAFVDVECGLGHLMGQLNDWNPHDGDIGSAS